MKLDEVLQAINKFHSDTSRTPEETLEGLELIVEEVEPMIDGLKLTIAEDSDG